MKNLISTLSFILFVGAIAVSAQSVSSAKADKPSDTRISASEVKDGEVQVYYFHATRRCATCQAVEDVCVKTIRENYGEEVSFQSIDLDKEKANPLIEKYEVEGQTLLVIKGDEKTDLTNEAFLYARSKPEKLEKKLKATIKLML